MGRAGRWLRNLWSGSKEHKDSSSYSSEEVRTAEKKRWSFRKARDSGEASSAQDPSTAAAIEAAWFRSFYASSEKEQSKHAIAVAAATAAAAEAALAAAEAAAAVVRIAGGGAGAALFGRLSEQMEVAAVKIQTAFRGYLARKARRALKALVKLQALVRGYIVRKQAAATLHSMQALVRAQRSSQNFLLDQDRNFLPEIRHRRSLERINDARNRHPSSFQTRRLSTSVDGGGCAGHCRSTKTVEIDAWRGRPRSFSRRASSSTFDLADDDSLLHLFSSPLPCQVPARLSIPSRRNVQENDWCASVGDDDRWRLPATAHNTPRYASSSAVTPAKSVCVAEGVFRQYSSVSSSPSYMANTRSSMARLQSQMMSKRQPLGEITMDARANLGGIGMQKSHSQVQEAFSFRKAVIEKLDRTSERGKEIKELYLQRRW